MHNIDNENACKLMPNSDNDNLCIIFETLRHNTQIMKRKRQQKYTVIRKIHIDITNW